MKVIPSTIKLTNEQVLNSSNDTDVYDAPLVTADVNSDPTITSMFSLEIINSPNNNSSPHLKSVIVSAMDEALIAAGFEKVYLLVSSVTDGNLFEAGAGSLSNSNLELLFQKVIYEDGANGTIDLYEIDLTEKISKNRLNALRSDGLNLRSYVSPENELLYNYAESGDVFEYAERESSRTIYFSALEESAEESPELQQRIADIGIQKIKSFSTTTNISVPKTNQQIFNSPIANIIEGLAFKNQHRKKPSLISTKGLSFGTDELSDSLTRVPVINSVKARKTNKISAYFRQIDISKFGSGYSFKIYTVDSNGFLHYKNSTTFSELDLLKQNQTAMYQNEKLLPKLNVSNSRTNEVLLSVSNIHPLVEQIALLKRELSRDPNNDVYSLISTQNVKGLGEYQMYDVVNDAKAYKYICLVRDKSVPGNAFGSPNIFSSFVHIGKHFEYGRYIEPSIEISSSPGDQIQTDGLTIRVSNIPGTIRKLTLYRKSSLDMSKKTLVDAALLSGVATKTCEFVDHEKQLINTPQNLEYYLVGHTNYGTEINFEKSSTFYYRPKFLDRGFQQLNTPDTLLTVSISPQPGNIGIKIIGSAKVNNIFIANGQGELQNPSQATIDAATNNQKIVKIKIERLTHGKNNTDIIYNKIINPGLSNFDLINLNTIPFEFTDDATSSSIYGFPNLSLNKDYTYKVSLVIYPLSLELHKNSQYQDLITVPEVKIGSSNPTRRDMPSYKYDPRVFDFPSYTKMGIIPIGPSALHYIQLEKDATISRSVSLNYSTGASSATPNQPIAIQATPMLDASLNAVIKITGQLTDFMRKNIDHLKIEMSYNTTTTKDSIDIIYAFANTFEYYDYSFTGLAADRITYQVSGIGKDFNKLFSSNKVEISMADPLIAKAKKRIKALGFDS